MTGLIELVAMSRLGDVYVIKDAEARWWLLSPFSDTDQSELKTQADVDRVISYGDLREVNRSFDAYSTLGAYLDEQASLVPVTGIAQAQVHSAQQVELLLDGALDWASDGTVQGLEIAAATIDRLLDSSVVKTNPLLSSRVESARLALQEPADLRRDSDDLPESSGAPASAVRATRPDDLAEYSPSDAVLAVLQAAGAALHPSAIFSLVTWLGADINSTDEVRVALRSLKRSGRVKKVGQGSWQIRVSQSNKDRRLQESNDHVPTSAGVGEAIGIGETVRVYRPEAPAGSERESSKTKRGDD